MIIGLISFLVFQTPPSEDPAELFRKIWSPYCKGISLLECPSSQAEDLRMLIRREMQSGKTQAEVWEDLQKKYGDQLRMVPDAGGRESLAYWLPYIAFSLAALGTLVFWLRRKKSRPAQSESKKQATAKVSEALQERILRDAQRD